MKTARDRPPVHFDWSLTGMTVKVKKGAGARETGVQR